MCDARGCAFGPSDEPDGDRPSDREVIAALDRQGVDSTAAMTLLRQFEAWVALDVADRDRLRRELGV